MEPEQNNTQSIIKKGALGLLTLGIIAGVGIYLSQTKDKSAAAKNEDVITTNTNEPTSQAPTTTSAPATTAATPVTAAPTPKPPVATTSYKDGAYSATGSYDSPAGTESISVSLAIANDTVKSATFTGNATNNVSKKWQANFAAGFDQAVVGKSIDSLSLTVVNGSSLTPKGFMEALVTIKKEAKI